jgi:hypothetical protein
MKAYFLLLTLFIVGLASSHAQASSSQGFCILSPFEDKFGTNLYFVDCTDGINRADNSRRRASVDRPLSDAGLRYLQTLYPGLTMVEFSRQKTLIDLNSFDLNTSNTNVVATVFEKIEQPWLARLLGNKDYHSLRFSYTAREASFTSICRVHLKSFEFDSMETMLDNADLQSLTIGVRYPHNGSYSGTLAGVWFLNEDLSADENEAIKGDRYQHLTSLGYEVFERCTAWVRD